MSTCPRKIFFNKAVVPLESHSWSLHTDSAVSSTHWVSSHYQSLTSKYIYPTIIIPGKTFLAADSQQFWVTQGSCVHTYYTTLHVNIFIVSCLCGSSMEMSLSVHYVYKHTHAEHTIIYYLSSRSNPIRPKEGRRKAAFLILCVNECVYLQGCVCALYEGTCRVVQSCNILCTNKPS